MNKPSPPAVVPFVEFMADALYDPAHGYYSAQIKTVGRGGDFSTSATLHPALGSAIRSWLKTERYVNPDVRDVIEIGPGDGSLMAEVQRRDWWFQPRRFRYHLVETSPVLRKIQKRRFGRNVLHHSDIHSALEAAGGRAFIYSNELVDAFPATLLQWDPELKEWREVCITQEILTREVTRPFGDAGSLLPVSSALSAWTVRHPPPHPEQRIEIHFSYRDWLQTWSSKFKAGAMLTIDYGDQFPAVYHRRPRGTVRGYFAHLALEGNDVYERPGKQDITADVNFTDLENWYRECGWTTDPLTTQADFIRSHGWKPPKWKREKDRAEAAHSHLLMTPGAGDAFKVLAAHVPS